ncbi:hypothetical protein X798_07290, partial [Onchocerca flexuosa]
MVSNYVKQSFQGVLSYDHIAKEVLVNGALEKERLLEKER